MTSPLIRVRHWEEELADFSWPILSWEAERFWLPSVGPTTFLLARRLIHDYLGETVEKAQLAYELGLTPGHGTNSVLNRSLRRLQTFGACQLHDAVQAAPEVVSVRTYMPPLGADQFRRLPAHLQDAYKAASQTAAAESDRAATDDTVNW